MYVDRTSMLVGGYMIPPGNGLPELHLDVLDPIDYVTQEINARTPVQPASVVGDAVKKVLGVDELKKNIEGLGKAVALALVGLILIIFGGYLLTKD